MDEFALIREFFEWPQRDAGVRLGPGDDCAVLTCPVGRELCVSTDTMVEGHHFFSDSPPELIAERALAAALSDLAAMAADPHWFSLALSLPDANIDWLRAFSTGLRRSAEHYGVDLIGGDTTRGPLTISVQVFGSAPIAEAIQRNTAQPGDLICVSGQLGGSAGALARLQAQQDLSEVLLDRYYRPQARFDVSGLLRGRASAMIDISDGFLADLGHICLKSQVGAELALQNLPVDSELAPYFNETESLDFALRGGEDFELCFTLPPGLWPLPEALATKVSCVGEILSEPGIVDERGQRLDHQSGGFQHFG